MNDALKPGSEWHDLGLATAFEGKALQPVQAGRTALALVFKGGVFSAVSGICNHAGGPLGEGRLDGDFIVCPWHNWKFHSTKGHGEPGSEEDQIPVHETKIEGGHLFVDLKASVPRHRKPHPPHPLARPVARESGPLRMVGISTTVMDRANPRYSTSDALLETALEGARAEGAETRLIKLNDLNFRACEGYYSKSARACTWPCSITQMDENDQLDQVYEALVHWADAVVVATPIRWGSASSLYYRMVERMNCIQNQVTIADRVLICNKVATFIITGGQDNIQAVAGQMLGFFGELGFLFPQFPYIAHSRGWTAEDMERNVAFVQHDTELHQGARDLASRALDLAKHHVAGHATPSQIGRGGRKAHQMKSRM